MRTVAIIVGVVVLLLIVAALVDTLPKLYARRNCAGRKWAQEFPGSSKDEIRKFLLLFVDAFAFKPAHRLQFEPSDRIIDIYNATTGRWGVDSMELETLAATLEREYRVAFSSVWREGLTLGDLFSHVTRAQQCAAPDSGDATRPPRE
jgi:hypothetical protein